MEIGKKIAWMWESGERDKEVIQIKIEELTCESFGSGKEADKDGAQPKMQKKKKRRKRTTIEGETLPNKKKPIAKGKESKYEANDEEGEESNDEAGDEKGEEITNDDLPPVIWFGRAP